jgi:hypothetical protein
MATIQDNNRNKPKRHDNISGTSGVYKSKDHGLDYWISSINDNDNKAIMKRFSIKKLGDEQAKNRAILQRNMWKMQYGYLGE